MKQVANKTIYLCEECGLGYDKKDIAFDCEVFCRETNSCSFEITRKAVYRP